MSQEKAAKDAATEKIPGGETVVVALNDSLDRVYTLAGGRQVRLNCGSTHLRGAKRAQLPVGAYGLTVLAKADWEEIRAIYGQTAVFKNGLIFAQSSQSKAEDQAAERRETRHGLEPVDIRKTRSRKAEKE